MKKYLFVFSLVAFSHLAVADSLPAAGPLFAASLNNADDQPVALERYKGKALIVNFWARWCAPCRAEIPELIRFRAAHADRIEVLGIGIEDNAPAVKEFARNNGIDYPVFVAREKGIPLMQALGNSVGGLPFTLFIDRDGRVVDKKLGMIRKADLDAAAPLLLKN
ncbi:MAG: TlpA family protein disulfide reductase [Bacteroidota bacterium]